MKANWITVLLALALGVALAYIYYSSSKKPVDFTDQTKVLNKQDLNKLFFWDKFQNSSSKLSKFSKPVIPEYALACVNAYETIYQTPSAHQAEIQAAFTEVIGFPAADIQSVIDIGSPKNLNIMLGMYVKPSSDPKHNNFGLTDKLQIDYCNSKAGRLTAFLWPCDENNAPMQNLKPLNFGDLQP